MTPARTGGGRSGGPGGPKRRSFFRRRKSCPFAGPKAPKIDYKDVKLLSRFTSERGNKDIPAARVAQAAVSEYRRSTKTAVRDPEALRARITTAMDSQIALEADDIAERLNFLATVGSVAPFVGLFGTVWGIMNSFFQIGAQNNSSLAVVAPGISEALFATAIGLFAAIPAVIAYNRLSASVNSYEAILQRFADRFNANLGRELERV